MNQILYIKPNKKEKKPFKGKIIIILLAICIIVVAAFFIGKAIFTMMQNNNQIEITTEPVVEISQDGNELKISTKHDKPIEKIVYKWQNNEETEIEGLGRQQIEEIITVPVGTNKLTLKVTDEIGKTVTYRQEYTGVEGDVKKPEVNLEVEGQKIKITAKDETALEYIEYHWNDEDETKVEATGENAKQIEEKVDILKGENTLTVTAKDTAGNTQKVEQTYRGSKKPKIAATQEGTNLVIKVADEQGIKTIEYNLNGTIYSSDPQRTGAPLGRTEVEFKQPLAEGENKIDITVINVDGLEAEFTWEGTSSNQ